MPHLGRGSAAPGQFAARPWCSVDYFYRFTPRSTAVIIFLSFSTPPSFPFLSLSYPFGPRPTLSLSFGSSPVRGRRRRHSPCLRAALPCQGRAKVLHPPAILECECRWWRVQGPDYIHLFSLQSAKKGKPRKPLRSMQWPVSS